jgi:tyrosine-protein kinase Etk/Wzc
MADQTRDQVNFLKIFAFLLQWRRFILTAAFTVAIVVAIISFVVTPRFSSVAVVRMQSSPGTGIGSLIASKLGGLGALAGMSSALGAESPEEVALAILRSRWMSERAIDAFDLRAVYKMKKDPIEDVIKMLQKRAAFDVDEHSNAVIVTVNDQSAKRAKEMADFFVQNLDDRNQELRSQTARREKEFTGMRLDEERGRLTSYEDSLFKFQLATGVLDIEEQVKATVQAAATVEAERLAARTKLEMNKRIFGSLSPETQYSQLQLSSIDSSIQTLIRAREKGDQDFMISLKDIPQKGITFLRLKRDIEIQQLLVAYLLQQHEQAKIEELRNTPTLLRLDPPTEGTKKTWPKRGMMTVIAFAAAFVFSTAIAYLMDFFTKASRDMNHPQHTHIQAIRQAWSRKRS